MGIAITLKQYLDNHEVDYEVVNHPYASTSMDIAWEAHVPPEKIAKCVMLEDEGGYVMAVCSASSRVKLGNLYREINRRLEFANEQELLDLLGDCVLGAVPPIGDVYNIEVVIDEELLTEPDVYFEAGDHEELIHVAADAFDTLMKNAERASFSQPM
jgi:Ala-tRNA(Pro) deacylase